MKDLSNIPTADLVAEWANLETKIADRKRFMMVNKSEQDDIDYLETHLAQRNAIAAELDSRTVGMNLMDGMPEISINHVSILKQMTLPPKPVAVRFNIPLDELIERLKWIKLKPNVRP